MAEEKKISEKVTQPVRVKILETTRRAVKDATEKVTRDLVERGFEEKDVRPHVADGISVGYSDYKRGK